MRLTTDVNGNKLTEEGSFPFGEQWYETGPSNNWFFTSYDEDSESGLNYALARYYDSRTGTFCSADPLAGDPSDPQSWNRYPYGRNDPIMITDPSGKSWWSDLIGGALDVLAFFVPPTVGLDLAYNFTNSAAEGNIIGVAGAVVGGAFAAGAQEAADANAAAASAAHSAGPVLKQRVVFPSPDNMSDVDAFASDRIVKNGLGFLRVGLVISGATQATNQKKQKDCETKILNATNNQFKTGVNPSNITSEYQYSDGVEGRGTLNLNIASSQAAKVSAGRYPLHWWSYVIGFGTTLHIPGGAGGSDSPLTLTPNAHQFTAHLDSAYPYGIGIIQHYLQDMKGVGGYQPCP